MVSKDDDGCWHWQTTGRSESLSVYQLERRGERRECRGTHMAALFLLTTLPYHFLPGHTVIPRHGAATVVISNTLLSHITTLSLLTPWHLYQSFNRHIIIIHWHYPAGYKLSSYWCSDLVMMKKHYTKLVTCVSIVTIMSMFSAMITDLQQYWRRGLSQEISISPEGKRPAVFVYCHIMVIFSRTQRRLDDK